MGYFPRLLFLHIIGTQLDSHLTQRFLPSQKELLFTTVNTSTFVAVVYNVLEVKKRSDKINVSANGTMARSETASLQRRKQEGNKTGVLLYCFNKHGNSR